MTPRRFIDANVILRHALADDPAKSKAATQLFVRIAEGAESAWSTVTIVSETVWILGGPVYRHSPERIREALLPIISLRNLEIVGRANLVRAFDYYVDLNIDFIDALHGAMVEEREPPELYSFDRDFDHIPGVTRIEPGT